MAVLTVLKSLSPHLKFVQSIDGTLHPERNQMLVEGAIGAVRRAEESAVTQLTVVVSGNDVDCYLSFGLANRFWQAGVAGAAGNTAFRLLMAPAAAPQEPVPAPVDPVIRRVNHLVRWENGKLFLGKVRDEEGALKPLEVEGDLGDWVENISKLQATFIESVEINRLGRDPRDFSFYVMAAGDLVDIFVGNLLISAVLVYVLAGQRGEQVIDPVEGTKQIGMAFKEGSHKELEDVNHALDEILRIMDNPPAPSDYSAPAQRQLYGRA